MMWSLCCLHALWSASHADCLKQKQNRVAALSQVQVKKLSARFRTHHEQVQKASSLTCLGSIAELPKSERADARVRHVLDPEQNPGILAAQADKAARAAFEELASWLDRPGVCDQCGDECLHWALVPAFGGSTWPDVRSRAMSMTADKMLHMSQRVKTDLPCDEILDAFATMLDYNHYMIAAADFPDLHKKEKLMAVQEKLVSAVNRALDDDCHAVQDLLGDDANYDFGTYPRGIRNGDWDKAMVTMWKTDQLFSMFSIANVRMLDGVEDYLTKAYDYWMHFPLPLKESFYSDDKSKQEDVRYFGTHATYLATGYNRYSMEKIPETFSYHQKEFYPVLADGFFDLVGEFVDNLRQGGCNEANDVEVRDGTRFLLREWEKFGRNFTNVAIGTLGYKADEVGDYEYKLKDSYDMMHTLGFAIMSLHERTPELEGGSGYGDLLNKIRMRASEKTRR